MSPFITGFYRQIKNQKTIGLLAAVFLAFMVLPSAALPKDQPDAIKAPQTIQQGLHYLLGLVEQPTPETVGVNIDEIAPVLDFVASKKPENTMIVADDSFDAPSAYHEFVFDKNLSFLFRFSFNPDIPSFITTPSSVRLCHWNGNAEEKTMFPALGNSLETLEKPIQISGVETIENTPDTFTGGYYKYDLDRTLLIFSFKGKPVLISLSKQTDTSDVGKKGIVLGSDDDWNYLYSGEKGLNKTGLGWVSSYMYDSYSIIIYYEVDSEKPLVKCGAFKWLRAGWKSINMVKNYHIYSGLKRFATTYKAIIENPQLPEPGKIADAYRKISNLNLETLRQLNHQYFQSLKIKYAQDPALSKKWVAGLFEDSDYLMNMKRDEMQSVLLLEYMKRALGKPYEIDLESSATLVIPREETLADNAQPLKAKR